MDIKKNKVNIKIIAWILGITIMSIVLVLHLIQQVNYLIYNERRDLLTQLVETSASTIDDNIHSQWRLVDFYVNDAKTSLSSDDEILDYLSNVAFSEDYYFFVDNNGKYYCSDGHYGRIVDNEYYYNYDDDEIEYIGSLPHLDVDSNLIFRKRLDTPIYAKFEGNDIQIDYCCCVHSFDDLNETISNVFERCNNTIIFDKQTGVMLYHEFNLGLLINGYNVYPKYSEGKLKYGVKADDVISTIKNDETTISLMEINNNDVYICTSSINVENWTLLMVVDTDFFSQSSNRSLFTVLLSMGLVVAMLGIMAIGVYMQSVKAKQENEVKLALQSAYKTKSNFLSYMSHDIRTPINGIIGMANIGYKIEGNSQQTNDCFKKIDTAGKHLLSLVNDVLDMSALESGKVVIKEDSFNINNLLNSCLDIINGQLSNRELTLISNFDLTHENLIGDELHLKQILINILGNALKFTNDGGQITFNAKETKLENNVVTYEIEITDTGIGMDKHILEHLFDAYVQGNNRSIYKGSGLGMAISYQFVKMMNGEILVESQEGKGSSFKVIVPFTIDNQIHVDDISDFNILVVEDNELNIEIAKGLLNSKGAKVTIAKDGLEAVEVFKQSQLHQFDVILMDMMMPKMNGLEASKAIRKLDRTDNNIPIIGASANTFKDDIEAMKNAGMNDHVSKPLDIEILAKTICKVRAEYENNK